MSGMSTLEESAALKSAMIDRISSHLYAEFDKQFGAQIVRLELEVSRLHGKLSKAVRCLALYNAALAKVFDGQRFPGGDPNDPSYVNVFCELPTGQIAITYTPAQYDLIECVPLARDNPWDGHSEDDAMTRLKDFAAKPEYARVTFTPTFEPFADLSGYFRQLDEETSES